MVAGGSAVYAVCETFGRTTNSTRPTPFVYRFSTATYLGARCCNSERHAASGTSTRRTPREKSIARVRPATSDPQASGQASSTASALGALRKLPTSIFSIAGAIGSTGIPILTFSADSRRLRIPLGLQTTVGSDPRPNKISGRRGRRHLVAGAAGISTPIFSIAIFAGKCDTISHFISAFDCGG